MNSFIYPHLWLALLTFFTGGYVFLSKKEFRFDNLFVIGYVHLHLLTAITGLFLGDMNIAKFSPFQWLSVVTIISYILTMVRINQQKFSRAKYPMLGAYLGLCIAFAGALHPSRITGYRLWIKTLNLDLVQASNYWVWLMAIVSIPCLAMMIYFNYREIKKRY